MRTHLLLFSAALLVAGACGRDPSPGEPAATPLATIEADEREQATSAASARDPGAKATDQWPQWRGPFRDGVSRERGLLASWQKGGPRLLWTAENLGIGFSGPAIVDGVLYTMGARDGRTSVLALRVADGSEIWAAPFGDAYVNGWGDGPRGTPTVDGKRLYALAAQGELCCVNVESGKIEWERNLVRDFGGGVPNWGYCESPLVEGDRLLVTPGGNQCIVALDKKSGRTIWTSSGLTDGAQYSSLIHYKVGAVSMLSTMTTGGLVGVAAADGRFLWRFPRTANGTAVIPTPIFDEGFVYSTSGYSAGCGLVRLLVRGSGVEAKEVYFNKEMVNQHGGVILHNGYVYGYSDGKGWVCQRFKDGSVAWRERRLGKGSIVCADGRLYCYTENEGTCVLADASPRGWRERGRLNLPRQTSVDRKQGKIWTHPVVAEGKLFLRDQDLVFCFDVKKE